MSPWKMGEWTVKQIKGRRAASGSLSGGLGRICVQFSNSDIKVQENSRYLCALDATLQTLQPTHLLDGAPTDPPDVYTSIPTKTNHVVPAMHCAVWIAGVCGAKAEFIYGCKLTGKVEAISRVQQV